MKLADYARAELNPGGSGSTRRSEKDYIDECNNNNLYIYQVQQIIQLYIQITLKLISLVLLQITTNSILGNSPWYLFVLRFSMWCHFVILTYEWYVCSLSFYLLYHFVTPSVSQTLKYPDTTGRSQDNNDIFLKKLIVQRYFEEIFLNTF